MIGPNLRAVYHAPMLEGMPEGTTCMIENDGCWGSVVYRTGENVTEREINLCGEARASFQDECFIKAVHVWFKRVYDEHWLATYNVWRGWRV